ncbi:Glucose and ribitol dehydrogenase, partial [Bienertia sinuspersici]
TRGGDSGIGRARATVAFTYVKGAEDKDTNDALALIREAAKAVMQVIPLPFQLISEVKRTVRLNNAGAQYYKERIEDITEEQLRNTFEINIFTYVFIA